MSLTTAVMTLCSSNSILNITHLRTFLRHEIQAKTRKQSNNYFEVLMMFVMLESRVSYSCLRRKMGRISRGQVLGFMWEMISPSSWRECGLNYNSVAGVEVVAVGSWAGWWIWDVLNLLRVVSQDETSHIILAIIFFNISSQCLHNCLRWLVVTLSHGRVVALLHVIGATAICLSI